MKTVYQLQQGSFFCRTRATTTIICVEQVQQSNFEQVQHPQNSVYQVQHFDFEQVHHLNFEQVQLSPMHYIAVGLRVWHYCR